MVKIEDVFEIIKNSNGISINSIAKKLGCDYWDVHNIVSFELSDICMRNPHGDYAQWIMRSVFAIPETENCLCPKCKSAMIKRASHIGIYKNNFFWGCSKYPECEEIVSIVQKEKLEHFGLLDKVISIK